MTRPPFRVVLAGFVACAAAAAAQAPPSTDVYLASLTRQESRLVLGELRNISSNPGYDNQPSFTHDGRSVLFTSVRGGGTQSDIYRYDRESGRLVRVTDTPESEYSPTVTPDGAGISVIRVEADGTQRLWRFGLDGREPHVVLADLKPVGYHAWIDATRLALFVLGQPATLQLADISTGKAEPVADSVGRSLHRIPGVQRVSFVHKDPSAGWWVKELDPDTKASTSLVRTLDGSEDCTWTPDGTLLMAQGARLFAWRRGSDAGWEDVANLATAGVERITRLAVSPSGDALALVAAER